MSNLINYGLGYNPSYATAVPFTAFTPSQKIQIVNQSQKIHTEMAKAAKSADIAKKKGKYLGDQYYMPKDAVGVM